MSMLPGGDGILHCHWCLLTLVVRMVLLGCWLVLVVLTGGNGGWVLEVVFIRVVDVVAGIRPAPPRPHLLHFYTDISL